MDKQTIIIIITLGVILVLLNFLHSDLFLVQDIKIEGNDLLSAEYLRNFSDLKTGDNIFAINSSEAQNRLLTLPQLKDVSVTRSLPNQILIEVTERKPLALIPEQDEYYLINYQGWVLKTVDNLAEWDLPVIKGKTAELKQEERLQIDSRLELAIDYLIQLPEYLIKEVVKMEIDSPQIEFQLVEGGLVKLGEGFDPKKQAQVFVSIYQEISERELEIKYVDLRHDRYSFIKPR